MRVILAAVLAAATVTACSSSGGSGQGGASPTAGGRTSPSADFCKHLSTAVHETRGLRSALANPQQMGSKLQPLISSFESLKAEAPPSVSNSIDELLSGMRGAHQAIAAGNMQALRQKMTQILPKVEHDFTVLGHYVATHCHGTG